MTQVSTSFGFLSRESKKTEGAMLAFLQLWNLWLCMMIFKYFSQAFCLLIFHRKNGHATNTAVEIDGRRDGPREDEFEQDDDGKIVCCFMLRKLSCKHFLLEVYTFCCIIAK